MKTTLRNWMFALMLLVGCAMPAWADKDTPISVNQLPNTAQQVVNRHFSGRKVALAKQETGVFEKSYEIIFTNGDKVEFDRGGNWTELDCKYSSVPSALVPSAIRSYVAKQYAGSTIRKIERDRNGYEVKLSNGVEIEFNKKFQVVDIDI